MLHLRWPVLRIGEIIVLVFVIIVIFSASRMGALGNALGKFVYSFRKASKGQDLIDVKRTPIGPASQKNAHREQDAEIAQGDDGKAKPSRFS
jgi:sec-independent protein translocase protein TatA